MNETPATIPRIEGDTITGRELLLQIRELILAEPLRLDMDSWITAFAGEGSSYHKTLPACGTVGCIAGWAAVLLRPAQNVTQSDLFDFADFHMASLLGLDNEHTYDQCPLFCAAPMRQFGEMDIGQPGTVQHAAIIAKRIDTVLERFPEIADRVIDVADARRLFGE
jgi:hypothetical protein